MVKTGSLTSTQQSVLDYVNGGTHDEGVIVYVNAADVGITMKQLNDAMLALTTKELLRRGAEARELDDSEGLGAKITRNGEKLASSAPYEFVSELSPIPSEWGGYPVVYDEYDSRNIREIGGERFLLYGVGVPMWAAEENVRLGRKGYKVVLEPEGEGKSSFVVWIRRKTTKRQPRRAHVRHPTQMREIR